MTSQVPMFDHGHDRLQVCQDAIKVTTETRLSQSSFNSLNAIDGATKSRELYRQSSITPDPAIPRSASQETQQSLGKKKTPIRAVFYDLPTAHSSITSGSVRSRARAASNALSEIFDEEDSIPLQDLEPTNRQDKAAFRQDLPLPSLTAPISYDSDKPHSGPFLTSENDEIVSGQYGKLAPPDISGQPGSVPISSIATTSTPSNWPRQIAQANSDVKYEAAVRRNRRDYNIFRHDLSSPKLSVMDSKSSEIRETQSNNQYRGNISPTYHSSYGGTPSESLPLNIIKDKSTFDPTKPPGISYGAHHEPIPFPSLHSAPAANTETPTLLRHSSKTTGALSNKASSMLDCSTVGNIYKHYARFDVLDNLDSGSDEEDDDYNLTSPLDRGLSSSGSTNNRPESSPFKICGQRRVDGLMGDPQGQPPGYALPSIPNTTMTRVLPSTSQALGYSSSYGDTHNLLELTERSQWTSQKPALTCSNAETVLRPDQAASQPGSSSRPNMAYPSSNNWYHLKNSPHVIATQAPTDQLTDHYDDSRNYKSGTALRQPLEREVSKALRRASNFSAYSDGSIASSVLNRYGQELEREDSVSNEIGLARRLGDDNTPPPEVRNLDEETRAAAARVEAFYDQHAIGFNWKAAYQQNRVRVPIKQNEQFQDFPPSSSPQDPFELPSLYRHHGSRDEPADDINDWETVGESGFETEFKGSKDTPGMLGGVVHRAGSSLANTSDDGTASTREYLPELDEFGSTDRIVQHPPANIGFFGDYRMAYRQKHLKETQRPVFLPKYREHNVNGYLADSNRIRPPPNPFHLKLRPLAQTHKNPFKSPPPEVLKSPKSKAHGTKLHQHAPNPHHLPPSINTFTTSEESNLTEQNVAAVSLARPNPVFGRISKTIDWMTEFGEPGPTISRSQQQYLNPIIPVSSQESLDLRTSDRHSSWQHVMRLGAKESIEGCNLDGSRIGDRIMIESSSSGEKLATGSVIMHADRFVETPTCGGRSGLTNPREHRALMKGPPGAFYHDLSSSKHDYNHASLSMSNKHERPPRVPAHRRSRTDKYPTNALRPLSLVLGNRPSTPIDRITRDASVDTMEGSFSFRSPLAPVKRKSWQILYTREHLQEITEAARADGIFDTFRHSQLEDGLLRDSQGSSRRQLWESPRLYSSVVRESIPTSSTPPRKQKFSILMLALCNLFPPMLALYGTGLLDGIMVWWSEGEFTAFAKSQKRLSLFMMLGWALGTFIGLIIFLVYWFTVPRS